MRTLPIGLAAVTLAVLASATPALAQTKFPAVLEGHAILPAQTFVPAPADAPPELQISGRYAGPTPQRVDAPESVPGISALSDKAAPRPIGISLPFKGQPVQGLSGIRNLKDGTFLTLTDNGFGSKANSPDAMLMFHIVKPDWKSGNLERVSTTFLSDPDRKVPFRIVNENTPKRYLTGSDFDIESIQPIGDTLWFGDELGPFLLKTDRSGKVLAVFDTKVDGKIVRSPDNPYLVAPGAPGMMKFEVKRSKGFEGMAQSPDGKTLYPLLEGALVLDAGCGLGHALVALRRAYPKAQLHGIEWSWPLRALCALRCPWARVRQGDIWRADWGPYDLVYLFQRPESMPRAVRKARAEMRPGSWLVSLEFEARQIGPHQVLRDGDAKPVWLYRAPFAEQQPVPRP
ncbi:MAG: esterase-like activity of phytase family protein [Enhydrobacter sp.]